MAEKPIVPMIVLSKDLKKSLRLGKMSDVVQGNTYYWQPEMGGLGKIAQNKVDFTPHKSSREKRVYRSFFSWLINEGRMHVVETKEVKKDKNDRTKHIQEGKGLFG